MDHPQGGTTWGLAREEVVMEVFSGDGGGGRAWWWRWPNLWWRRSSANHYQRRIKVKQKKRKGFLPKLSSIEMADFFCSGMRKESTWMWRRVCGWKMWEIMANWWKVMLNVKRWKIKSHMKIKGHNLFKLPLIYLYKFKLLKIIIISV